MVHFLDRLFAPFLRQIFKAPIIEDTIMKPILIDGCQLAAQAAIEIVEDSVVAPHCSKLLNVSRSCRRRPRGNAAMLHIDGTSYRRINRTRKEAARERRLDPAAGRR